MYANFTNYQEEVRANAKLLFDVCVCVCVCVCGVMCFRTAPNPHVQKNTVNIPVCVCRSVNEFVCVSLCVYPCQGVCVCVCVCVCTRTHRYSGTCVCVSFPTIFHSTEQMWLDLYSKGHTPGGL